MSRILIVGIVTAVMAFALSACGGSSSGSAGSAGSASASSAASSASSATYIVSKTTSFHNGEAAASTNEIDEHGNVLASITETPTGDMVVKTEVDEKGYPVKVTQPNGEEITYESTFDGDKCVKVVGSNGAVNEYSYHANGVISEQKSQFGNDFESVSTFDEDGYLIKRVSEFGNGAKSEATYEWAFDSTGMPSTVTVSLSSDPSVTASGIAANAGAYTVECDAHGNIVKYSNAETGEPVIEYEYVEIADPSPACLMNASIKNA